MKQRSRFIAVMFVLLIGLFLGSSVLAEENSTGNSNGNNGNDSSNGIPEQIAVLQQEIELLKNIVTEQQNQFDNLQTMFQSEVTALHQTVSAQNEEISILKQTVEAQQRGVEELHTNVEELHNKDTEQQNDISEFRTQLLNLGNQLGRNVNNLTSQMSELSNSLYNEIYNLHSVLSALLNEQESSTYTISGNMVDVNGNPFASGIILIDQNGNRFHYDEIKPDGSFSFNDISNGTYTIGYFYRNYNVSSPANVVVSGSDITGITVVLETPTYSISGQALTEDGTPISNQIVRLQAPDNIGSYFWPRTSSDGSFSITGIAPGTYQLLIGDNSNNPIASKEVTVVDNDVTGVAVSGKSSYSIKVTMLDVNGKEFYHPMILDGNEKRYWLSGENGVFYFRNILNGTYNLQFFSTHYENVNTTSNQVQINGSDIDIVVQLSVNTYSVSGTALQSDGSPFAKTKVMIRDSYGGGWGGHLFTNLDGTFTIPGLPNGTYKVELGDDPQNPVASGYVTVEDGDVSEVIIQE
jgi:peptidoglycan hydrolase CwlO-like protein